MATSCCPLPWRWFWKRDRHPSPCSSCRLKLGYSRAARLVDQMEERGIVGPFEGSKPRQLLIDKAKWQELQMSKQPQPEPEIDRSGSIRDVFESRDALE